MQNEVEGSLIDKKNPMQVFSRFWESLSRWTFYNMSALIHMATFSAIHKLGNVLLTFFSAFK